MDVNAKYSLMGTLVNGTVLDKAQLVNIKKVGVHKEIQVIEMPTWDPNERLQSLKLSTKVYYDELNQRLFLKPAKMLYYNRIAKTGSISIVDLMRKLGKKNGFSVEFKARRNELVTDDLAGQKIEADNLLKSFFPAIFVRHYSFIEFAKFGGYDEWRPDWFNIVRHPVEKVISYFYYRRAPWKLVKLAIVIDEVAASS